jgi:uncharacterized membrane protein YkoI
MRTHHWVLTVALATSSVPLASTVVHADEKGEKEEKKEEKTVKLDEVPAAARQTLVREAGGSPILKVEKETENGRVLYEAHVKKGDDVLGIRVDAAGKLIDKHSEKHETK